MNHLPEDSQNSAKYNAHCQELFQSYLHNEAALQYGNSSFPKTKTKTLCKEDPDFKNVTTFVSKEVEFVMAKAVEYMLLDVSLRARTLLEHDEKEAKSIVTTVQSSQVKEHNARRLRQYDIASASDEDSDSEYQQANHNNIPAITQDTLWRVISTSEEYSPFRKFWQADALACSIESGEVEILTEAPPSVNKTAEFSKSVSTSNDDDSFDHHMEILRNIGVIVENRPTSHSNAKHFKPNHIHTDSGRNQLVSLSGGDVEEHLVQDKPSKRHRSEDVDR